MPAKKKKKTKLKRSDKSVKADDIPVYCTFDELADLESLKPNPANPNVHSEGQIELLAKLIYNHGWRHPITVSKRSGMIVAGHARYKAARRLGVTHVPVDRQDFKDWAEEHAVLVADNVIAELAETDGQVMADLLIELDRLNYDLSLTALNEIQIKDYVDGPIDLTGGELNPSPNIGLKTLEFFFTDTEIIVVQKAIDTCIDKGIMKRETENTHERSLALFEIVETWYTNLKMK